MTRSQYVEVCKKKVENLLRTTGPRSFLVRFVKNRRGHRCGVVVALKTGEKQMTIGWSKCSKRDTFSREIGLALALDRACEGQGFETPARSLAYLISDMKERARRYFKITPEEEKVPALESKA